MTQSNKIMITLLTTNFVKVSAKNILILE